MSNDILCTLQLKSMSFQSGKIPKKKGTGAGNTARRRARHASGYTAVAQLSRDRNDPKSGLASPNHTANLSGLVLSCTEADLCK